MTEPEMLDYLQYILRRLHKLDSKLWAGQEAQAWRDNKSFIAEVTKEKDLLLEDMKSREKAKINETKGNGSVK